AEIAIALGPDPDLILPHYEQRVPRRERLLCWGVFSMACERPVGGFLCLAARCLGRRREALQHFETATQQADRLNLRPIAAKLRCEWADTLIDGGTPDETIAAAKQLAAARGTAAEL